MQQTSTIVNMGFASRLPHVVFDKIDISLQRLKQSIELTKQKQADIVRGQKIIYSKRN